MIQMEWKAKGRHSAADNANDDSRTAKLCFLFEERVPMVRPSSSYHCTRG